MRQRTELQNLSEPIPGRETFSHFSRHERLIAKCGLCAAIPAAALHWLHRAFPDQPQIVAMFAVLGALTLIAASLCVLAKPAEATAKAVKKAANKWGLFYAGRVSANLKASKRLMALLQNWRKLTCRTRTNARAHRGISRPAFTHNSGSSGDKGSDDGGSDQGDPPGPSHQYTATTFTLSGKKLNIFAVPRLSLRSLGCWRAPENLRSPRGCAA